MSKRVMYELGGKRTLRIVQDDFGFRCQVLNRDGDWLPTTAWEDEWLPEFNALVARVSELETENAKLKEGLDRLVRIYNERTDEADKVREERNEAEYEAVELRAENARLRRYYEIAEEIRVTINNALAFRIDDLDAARTEVDKEGDHE